MLMRTLAAALVLLFASAAPARDHLPAKPCKPEAQVMRQREPMRVRPLNEQPPAKHILGIYREANGCTEPVVLRKRVGAPGR